MYVLIEKEQGWKTVLVEQPTVGAEDGSLFKHCFFFSLPVESYLLVERDSPDILPSAVLGNSLCLIQGNVLLHIFQANKISLPAVLAQMCSSYIAGFIATSIISELSRKGADAHTIFSLRIHNFF